jgi:hypothetical protein
VEQAIGVLKEQRNVEVRAICSVLSEGVMCITVNVTEERPIGETPPLSLAFLIPILIL